MAALCAALPGPAVAAPNAFGIHDPRPCPSVTGGTPAPTAAAELVACSIENMSSRSAGYVAAQVKVTTMARSKYDPHTQTGFTNMDTDVDPVVIKGSLETWRCVPQDPPGGRYSNAGANCSHTVEPQATGYCYKLRSKVWTCIMRDTDAIHASSQHGVPPPP